MKITYCDINDNPMTFEQVKKLNIMTSNMEHIYATVIQRLRDQNILFDGNQTYNDFR